MISAICSAAFGECHCASADCIFATGGFVFDQFREVAAIFSGVEFFCSSSLRRAGFLEGAGVEKLVVVRRRRKRHEQRRQAHARRFPPATTRRRG